ncbi:hypothetical protein BC826DRAFT_976483 [Russula brevipes]|nr:hypothetical protein BC826DRAFT_976483 [Russula brevipes]
MTFVVTRQKPHPPSQKPSFPILSLLTLIDTNERYITLRITREKLPRAVLPTCSKSLVVGPRRTTTSPSVPLFQSHSKHHPDACSAEYAVHANAALRTVTRAAAGQIRAHTTTTLSRRYPALSKSHPNPAKAGPKRKRSQQARRSRGAPRAGAATEHVIRTERRCDICVQRPSARASRTAGMTHAWSSQGGSSNGKTSPTPARSARRSVAHAEQPSARTSRTGHDARAEQRQVVAGTSPRAS